MFWVSHRGDLVEYEIIKTQGMSPGPHCDCLVREKGGVGLHSGSINDYSDTAKEALRRAYISQTKTVKIYQDKYENELLVLSKIENQLL